MEDDAYLERANVLLADLEAEMENGNDSTSHGGATTATTRVTDPSGYYACLGVSPSATAQEIRRAFLFLSQRYHTDKHASQSADIQSLMNDRFQQLQTAYAVLSDERQRAAYDAGGATGLDRLSLVPVGLHKREDILNYVLSLDREAQLLHTARMVSATSLMTLNFSTAHFFPLAKAAVADMEDEGESKEGGEEVAHGSEAGGGKQLPNAASPAASGVATSETSANTEPAPAAAAAPPSPAAAAAAVQAQLTAKEVIIDGERQIVLIPNADVQQQLRQRMNGQSGGSPSNSGGGALGNGAAPRRLGVGPRQLSPMQALMMSIIPKSMTFRSSFEHMVNPRLTITFRTDAVARLRQNATSLTTFADYQPDDVRTYTSSLRLAVTGLKLCLTQRRVLNPLWTLKSKLTALRGSQLLQKLELTITRKLSATAELENALAMSLTEHGYFRTSLNDYTEDAQHGASAYIGFHNLSLTAFTGGSVILGVPTNDPKNPPVYGRLQYTVNCSPLAGQTTLGLEAWYCPSKVQQYGISFTTVLPYAVSPIAPPLFLVASTQFAVVNQISLLYARGRHRISIPVIVFISPKVSQGLAWMSVPLAVYRIGSLLYRPYARARAARHYAKERRLHIADVDVAREKARMEQLALESLVLMSRATEERKGGLVIVNARYGVLQPEFVDPLAKPTSALPSTPPPSSVGSPTMSASTSSTAGASPKRVRPKSTSTYSAASTSEGWWPSQIASRAAETLVYAWLRRRRTSSLTAVAPAEDDAYTARHDAVCDDAIPLSIDVTVAVQNLVRDSALMLPAGTKSTLVGFCDPDPYTPEQKRLKIVYWFRKHKHMAVLADDEAVELPQREHRLA